MKICVFPNDSLLAYYEKGEIKNRYFNPKNFFDEVHVISLFDNEIDAEMVKSLGGKAKLKIHKMGKANLSNYKSFEERVTTLIQEIKPNIIRSFNPLVQGWLATKAAKKLGIPIVISLHTNYSQQKEFAKKEGRYLQYFKLMFTSRKFESFVLKNADVVICVYEFIVPYAKNMGAKNIHIIYNRVDLEKFSPQCKKEIHFEKPTILSVGRLIEQKNHQYLIQAIKNLDVNLLIIGDGPNYEILNSLAKSLGVSDKIQFIKNIPHEKLNGYYSSCDIYAQPMRFLGGIPIPVLEAMASGLPIVMSKHNEGDSEIIDDAIVFVENNADSFRNAFNRILSDPNYKNELKKKSLESIKKINGEMMEEKEKEIYLKLIKNY
jgi:glycosyltransferase involved in cell wall biosynthesis